MKKAIIRRPVLGEVAGNLDPLLARLYASRGIESMADLERGLEGLAPYSSLTNIDLAVDCLLQAIVSQEHILIVGDFDTDGATSTALGTKCLKEFGAGKVSFLVPNRFEYGYGLTPEIVDVAAKQMPSLIITVDNGITSLEGVERAHEKGIRVVITDHHLPGNQLPAAEAIINPNLPGDLFPSKNLAGVGVIFYVMLALRAALRKINWFSTRGIPEPNLANVLDLVALGTVADVVRLDKNNRILVHQGILRMRASKTCFGIKALLEIANKKAEKLSAADLGFAVAPRLNAAGRLVDMCIGVECLLAENNEQALFLARQLDALNAERKQLEAEMREQAIACLRNIELSKTMPIGLCLYDESWHQGIIGILASRVKDLLHRPVFAFAIHSEHELKGSGRSIEGLHLKDALEKIANEYPGLITKFGGHAMAAGVSLSKEKFNQFVEAFNKVVSDHVLEEDLQGVIHSDGELSDDVINIATARLLKNAGPWGAGFPEPVFDGHFKVIHRRVLQNKHIKFLLGSLENDLTFDAIAFNLESSMLSVEEGETLKIAYKLDINDYAGNENIQFVIEQFERGNFSE